MAENEAQKIVVEVPGDRGFHTPFPMPQQSRMEEFRKGWADAIALPDNLPDLAFELTSCLAIPALFSSCWVTIPIPGFVRFGVLILLAIAGVWACYLRQAVPEVEGALLLRISLIALGVFLGL